MRFEDVVFLVPGFLGFSRVGGYYYFADRVGVTVRSTLETLTKRSIPVVPVCTLPTDHLVERQKYLVQGLLATLRRIGEVRSIHLVGHSAGGVDAQLLTCDQPLTGGRWSDEAEQLREKIRSVITLASPHHGTCLSDAPVARLFADPLFGMRWLPSARKPVLDLLRMAANQEDFGVIAWYVFNNLPETSRFLFQFLVRRGLILDMSPRSMAVIRRYWRRSKNDILLRSFVTVAQARDTSDPFFRSMSALTSGTNDSPPTSAVTQTVALLNRHAGAALRSCASGELPSFDDASNDGVVNSARQVIDPGDADQFAGIVVADHADVMGHYDRQDELASEQPINVGLFHSGAGFCDDQFFTLYRRVAEYIWNAI